MKLSGTVKDKKGNALNDVVVEVKDTAFQTLYSGQSDGSGSFSMELPGGRYPFVTAVKEYGETYLEYWCHNIDLTADKALDITIDKLELYGLHAFAIKGAHNGLMVYFRPMSLKKFQKGEKDICPDIKGMTVCVDGRETKILLQNQVLEYGGDMVMRAFLLHVDNPNGDGRWEKLDVTICDEGDNWGAASVYNCN